MNEPIPSAGDLPLLLNIVVLAATGELEGLREVMAKLVDEQRAFRRVEEALLQLVPYAGVPRALAAFATLRKSNEANSNFSNPADVPDPASSDARIELGRVTFGKVYGERAESILARISSFHPELPTWILEDAYGRVLSRSGVLTLRERELLAVAMLAAMGSLEAPLLGHMRAAIRLGATRSDLESILEIVTEHGSVDRSASARQLVARV